MLASFTYTISTFILVFFFIIEILLKRLTKFFSSLKPGQISVIFFFMNIYLDTANFNQIKQNQKKHYISGFTTNPSLIKKENINVSYLEYCKKLSKITKQKPVSLEVISDNESEIFSQAKKLSKINNNIFVKIPIVNSKGKSLLKTIMKLINEDIKLNITAVFTFAQIKSLIKIKSKKKFIVSIFAGRIADTGRDPIPYFIYAKKNKTKNCKILWASCREILNINHAKNCGTDIITVGPEFLEKFKKLKNYNLKKFSKETAKMFYDDAISSNFKI